MSAYGELGTAKYGALRRRRQSWDEYIHRIYFMAKVLNCLDAGIGIGFHNNPSYEVGIRMKAEIREGQFQIVMMINLSNLAVHLRHLCLGRQAPPAHHLKPLNPSTHALFSADAASLKHYLLILMWVIVVRLKAHKPRFGTVERIQRFNRLGN